MTFLARQAFSKIFNQSPDDLDMAVLYDVSHNIAKFEVLIVICFDTFSTQVFLSITPSREDLVIVAHPF